MSVHDELTTVQRCLDDLLRSVGRLEKQLGGDGLEMRRVRTDASHLREDAGHLRESVALLRETAAGPATGQKRPDLVTIPDTPYDPSLWVDTDDEGLGARDRHAP